MNPCLERALEALEAGISVIPVKPGGSKAPAIPNLSTYFKRHATLDEIEGWWRDPRRGIGFVGGAISGQLEILDFDSEQVFADWLSAVDESGLDSLYRKIAAGYEERTPRGRHLLYYCPEAKATALARRRVGDGWKGFIETKGYGGYGIAAPSPADVHELRKPYELVCGGVRSIVTIDEAERQELFRVARIFDQHPQEEAAPQVSVPVDLDGDRPGDDYNRKVGVDPRILKSNGWTPVYRKGEMTAWRRPGKKDRGISATLNYDGRGFFHVFTSSTEFEQNKSHTGYQVYAILEHGGDWSAAARALKADGFGGPDLPTVDLSQFRVRQEEARNVAPEPTAKGRFPTHLLDVPGMVGGFHKYLTECAHHPQPILALGAAIAATGAALGRHVRSETDLRTNFYIAALAESGGGKEWLRKGIRRVFDEAGHGRMTAVDGVTSGAAINGVLEETPACLLMFDEMGHLIAGLKQGNETGVLPTLMKLHGLADGIYYGLTYAKDRRTGRQGTDYKVVEPCVSVLGTSVPRKFWGAFTGDEVEDGFLNRFLLFRSETPRPDYRKISASEKAAPVVLVDAVKAWRQWGAPGIGEHAEAGGGGPGATRPGQIADVMMTGEAANLLSELGELRAQVRDRIELLESRNEAAIATLYNRVPAHAIQLALVRAAGQAEPWEGELPEIGRDDAEWGAELALYLVESMAEEVGDHVGDSEHETRVRKARAWLRKKGGATKSAFTRAHQSWSPRERDDVLKSLEDGGEVERAKVATKGRPREVIQWKG